MKIWVYFIGKPRDAASNGIAAEFLKRSSRYAACEMREIHPDRFDLWGKHGSAQKVLLDPAGKLLNSAQFVDLIAKGEMEGPRPGVRHRWSRRFAARVASSCRLAVVPLSHDLPA